MTNTILKYHIFPTKRDHKNTLESNNKKKNIVHSLVVSKKTLQEDRGRHHR